MGPDSSRERPGVYLLMAIHCHQPVGNFETVFEEAFRRAYEPFLSVLERHPTIRLSLHYSGSLLDWLNAKQPAFLDRLKQLAQQGQVECLSSGYYEPILPLIPERDRRGQLDRMQRTIREQFGTTATGLWLTERVWEPELPKTLAQADIRYTILDTNQFQVARALLPSTLQVQDEQGWDLLGCYVTEYAGSSVVVFPASKRLRYWIPFQPVPQTIEFLKRVAKPEPVAITFADDGEKFGLWPKTYGWVYDEGWLEQFFSVLERESTWLKTATCSEYLEQVGPAGRVYLPCGSYEEMLEWSGGYFRNFFVKYPEANAMHQKMLTVSRALATAQQRSRPQRPRLIQQAQEELYKAQCNCAYWHGVFGGLYLAHLRRAVYSHLIAAEQLLARAAARVVPVESQDVDGDGHPEVLLRGRALSLVVDPAENGSVTELDEHHTRVNLIDTLARRYEPYHEHLRTTQLASVAQNRQAPASIHELLKAKEEGLETYLAYDDHRRSCFLDYALGAMPTLQEIWRATWGEHRLWSGGAWEVQHQPTRPAPSDQAMLTLVRRLQGGLLRKMISLSSRSPRLAFHYELSDLAIPVVGLEWNLSLRDERWRRPTWQEAVRTFQVRDPDLGLVLTMAIDPAATLACFPVETVSESESGLERTTQGLAAVLLWSTAGARRWSCQLQWTIEAR